MRDALSTLIKIQQGMQKVLAKLPANSSLFWKRQLKEKKKEIKNLPKLINAEYLLTHSVWLTEQLPFKPGSYYYRNLI